MTSNFRLTEIMPPAFFDVHRNIRERKYSQYVFKGGRGSCKSSFVSEEVIILLQKNPNIHAVVMRKVGNTLRNTVLEQYQWALDAMGYEEDVDYRVTTNPMRITFRKGAHKGQRIMFFGADDKGKLKSLKIKKGYVGILHFEELDQFCGEEEIRNIEQSVIRGGDITYEFKTFNPPQTALNWANKYCLRDKPDQLIFHSDYRSVPPEWLGQRFINDAEYLKEVNPRAYEHEYLGIANGTGGNVFSNIENLKMTDDLIAQFDRLSNGVDWGYYPDPFAFVRVHFDAARRDLYIYDELKLHKTGNREAADKLIAKGITRDDLIICDSAEPKSVSDFRSYGLMAREAIKGAGSVEYSMKWLASLSHIFIDADRCPESWEEFTLYEYEKDKEGNVVSGYPDKNNHFIDATRYATNHIWKRRGQ